MTYLNKHKFLVFLIFLLYFWFFLSTFFKPPVKSVIGASNDVELFIQPSSGEAPIINAINSATSEVLVKVYLLSDIAVISALKDAESRGITVYVMMEEHPFGGGNNKKTFDDLRNAGINVKWTNPAFALTHEKSIIIDKNKAFVLSQNLTKSSFSKNREYDILDSDPSDVIQIRNIFISDWERKNYKIDSSRLIDSPENSRSNITSLINSANNNLQIEMEDIADPKIVENLCEKAKIINVKIITPTLTQLPGNNKDLKDLKDCGVKAKTLSSPYIHAKMIMADQQKSYIGSVNLSGQSMDENRELGIFLTDQNILETINSTFQSDWEKAKSL